MDKPSFGQFLAQCRIKKGLTQKELADMLFVCESTISKWEKDRRKPDLDLACKLSEIFGITETELIHASVDEKRVTEKKQARKFRIINGVYNLSLFIGLGTALLVCFIVNLAVSHKLSWFFIVLSAIALAAIVLVLPQFIKKHRLLILPASWLAGLYLLLTVVCVYVRGNWLALPMLALLLAYSIIFTPLLISHYSDKLPSAFKKHNAVISVAIDTLILLVMLLVIDVYTTITGVNDFGWFFTVALPSVFYWLAPIAASTLILRYSRINWAFKTSALIALWLAAEVLFTLILSGLLGNPSEGAFWLADFSDWSNEDMISANVNMIVNASSLLVSLAFLVTGTFIAKFKKSK